MGAVGTGVFLPARQAGAVLVMAMVFLLLLALLASAASRTSTLEFRMAGNNQFREAALQRAEAVAAALAEDPGRFSLDLGVGDRACPRGLPDPAAACLQWFEAPAPAAGAAPEGVSLDYYIERRGPRLLDSPPVRQGEEHASSARTFDIALFESVVVVDGDAVRLGRAAVAEGIARRTVARGR